MTTNSVTLIKNAVLVTDKLVENQNLYIKGDKIEAIIADILPHDFEIDAKGLYVAPGFIDIHTHGGAGYSFTEGTVSDIIAAAEFHASHGTTTIIPSAASAPFPILLQFVKNVKEAMKLNAPGRPYIGGSHLEGPYFSFEMCGAQRPDYITPPIREEYEQYIECGEGTVKLLSFAPEHEGSKELCIYLKEHGVQAAFGHTAAVYEDIKPLIPLGLTLATHIYSGMNCVTRRNLFRKLGAVESAYLEDEICVEAIADGMHLPPELLKLVYKIKGPDKMCLITDSISAAGLPEGPFDDGRSFVKGGIAYLSDMTSFAGSVATTDRLARTMHKLAGVPLPETIKMMTQTPAKIIGLKNIGKLEKDYLANLVFFDDNINVSKVIINGKEFKKEK